MVTYANIAKCLITQMLPSGGRKERFRGCLAKTNYILNVRYECMSLGGLSWRVRWALQMWEFPQLLKLTDGLTAGAITRSIGPNLPQFICSEIWLDCWHKSFHPVALGCDTLQGVLDLRIEEHFHLHNWPSICSALYFKELLLILGSIALYTAKNHLQ